MSYHHHKKSHIPEYKVWVAMKGRCLNPRNPSYKNYGGRGIAVCENWKNSFSQFYEDMGPRPSKNMTLERIDNDGNYCPENCEWATRSSQNRNHRRNRKIQIDGETLCLTDWAEKYGICSKLVSQRISRGWDEISAIQTPADFNLIRVTCRGKTLTLSEWAIILGVSKKCLEARLRNYDVETALFGPKKPPPMMLSYGGGEYTVKQLAKLVGIDGGTLLTRLKRGLTVEEAIETPVRKYRKNVKS